MKKFFVVCPIGFEIAVSQEIRKAWPLLIGKDGRAHEIPAPALEITKGGVSFEADEFLALQLNFFLKTASRILLRLAEFRVRDFPKLHEKIKALPWTQYFKTHHLEYVVSASKSRLNHEGRIQETFEKTIKAVLPEKSAEIAGSVYVRIDDDLCTVSLDTTGEHLHKRGWAQLKGEAPLRETIASFILKAATAGLTDNFLERTVLFDPMVGSGTLLLEARTQNCPHWDRDFAFLKWKSCPKLFISPSFKFNYKHSFQSQFKAYWGFDISEKMVNVARENFAALESKLEPVQKKAFKKSELHLSVHDLWTGYTSEFPEGSILVSNPPYGERLRDGASGSLEAYFTALSAFKPHRMALLYPESNTPKSFAKIPGYRIFDQKPVLNGGLKTVLTVMEKIP